MWNALEVLVFSVAPLGGLAVSMIAMFLTKTVAQRVLEKDRESPLTGELLRPAGESQREALDDVNLEIGVTITMFLLIPIAFFSVHISQSYFAHSPESTWRIAAMVLATVACLAYFAWYWTTLVKKRRNHTVGLQGELATAEELNQLMRDGCFVFHDVPFDYGNIDHVVIGPTGVCTIETKAWGKPRPGTPGDRWTARVDRDRGTIELPDRTLAIPEHQTRSQARWLSRHLEKTTSEPVSVEPLVALPGWKVERTGSRSVCVFNPKNPRAFFLSGRGRALSESTINRIAAQVELLCRKLEPSYKADRSLGNQ